jgi:hypothetical protein
MPSTTLTPGLATDTAAIAGASWPVASESCWMRNAATPKPKSPQVARSVAVAPMLTWRSLMTGLSNVADRPKRRPEHPPRTAARSARSGCPRTHRSSTTTIAQITRLARRKLRVEVSSTPASGSPTSTKSARPNTTTSAPST